MPLTRSLSEPRLRLIISTCDSLNEGLAGLDTYPLKALARYVREDRVARRRPSAIEKLKVNVK